MKKLTPYLGAIAAAAAALMAPVAQSTELKQL